MNYSSNNQPVATPNTYSGGERLLGDSETAEQHQAYVEQLAPRAEVTPHFVRHQPQSIRTLVAHAGLAETQTGSDEMQSVRVIASGGSHVMDARAVALSALTPEAFIQAVQEDDYALAT